MTFILSFIAALILIFSPTIIAFVRCTNKEVLVVFLLNVCWALASFVQPLNTLNMNWMGWGGIVLMYLSFLFLFAPEKEIDRVNG